MGSQYSTFGANHRRLCGFSSVIHPGVIAGGAFRNSLVRAPQFAILLVLLPRSQGAGADSDLAVTGADAGDIGMTDACVEGAATGAAAVGVLNIGGGAARAAAVTSFPSCSSRRRARRMDRSSSSVGPARRMAK